MAEEINLTIVYVSIGIFFIYMSFSIIYIAFKDK